MLRASIWLSISCGGLLCRRPLLGRTATTSPLKMWCCLLVEVLGHWSLVHWPLDSHWHIVHWSLRIGLKEERSLLNSKVFDSACSINSNSSEIGFHKKGVLVGVFHLTLHVLRCRFGSVSELLLDEAPSAKGLVSKLSGCATFFRRASSSSS